MKELYLAIVSAQCNDFNEKDPMNKQCFACFMTLLAVLTGCTNKPPTVGKATELVRACGRSNDGKRIALEGYLKLPDEIPVDNTISVLLEIRLSKDVKRLNDRVGVWVQYGNETNRVAPVESKSTITIPGLNGAKSNAQPTPYTDQPPTVGTYTHADLHVTASDGQQITYTDRVRVSGKVGFPSSPETAAISPCVLNNPLIERIP
ncbi:MAG: hypothetical protein KME15_28060 [Drouetiella hepatica Uher 2000/2452]|jgi:hypothetical protein|uniref:Uncharacterized protein n=1 Tax=Drouetiella hepatica Uher 2000/2452 TaxID=904376 RepID=A0A951QH49_9CYAN|nr:hypothetical protein [Drouetiella hepatica Uher 2000/2452]